MKKFLLTTLLFVFTVYLLQAQVTTSSITGNVSDEKNETLPGVSITATHTPTGTIYATATRADGRFNLSNVRVGGPYTIRMKFIGYKEFVQENITLNLGQELKLNAKLLPESQQLAEVVVSGTQNKVINSSRTGSQETITRTQIDRLPTVGRSIYDYTKLAPTSNGTSFGGRSGGFNNLTVDGALFNNSFGLSNTLGGQANSQPISLDAIEQIQVNIAPFDVTQGRFSGAGINTVTKSGTNEFKGTIYDFERSADLVGLKTLTTKIPKPVVNYNQRGISVGGPIIKNKLFFFVSGEQERIKDPISPIRALQAGQSPGGNTSAASAAELNKLRDFLQSKFGYSAGSYEDNQRRTQSDKLAFKLDWNINKNNTLSAKYFYFKSFQDQNPSSSGAPSGGRAPSLTTLPFFSSYYTINNNFNIGIVELNTTISTKFSNKLTAGYTALRDFRESPGGGSFPLVDIKGGTSTAQNLTSFGYEPFTAFNQLNTDTYQLSDEFNIYAGKHQITIGTQNELNMFKNGFAPNYYGRYQFNSVDDFINSSNNGTPLATQYQLQYSALPDGSFPFAKTKVYQLGFFAQDKWQVKDNFKLTFGLRADVPIYDIESQKNTNVEALTFRNGVKLDVAKFPKSRIMLSPRLGFNWDVKSDNSTQVRGGAGLFVGPTPYVWISNQASNNGVQFGSYTINNSGTTANDPRFVFKPDVNANRPAAGAATSNTSYNLAVSDPNFKFTKLFRANAAVDQKLPFGIIGTLELLFGKDINGVYHQNVNLPATGTALAGADKRIRYSAPQIYGSIPVALGGNTAAAPNISDAILMRNTNKGYNFSASTQFQKSTKELYFSLAYAYSTVRSVNDGGSIAQSIWRDRSVSGDPNADVTSYSNFYQPHRVVAAASYRKEYAKHFATSVGLVYEAAAGGTFSYLYSGDLNGDNQGFNDLIYIPRDASEILLVADNATDLRTPAQLWSQLDAYINQDKYLYERRGKYAERNGGLLPYFKNVNLNITQDFFVNVKGKKNTIQLNFNIQNFGNFLNKNWGATNFVNRNALLSYKSIYNNATVPADPNNGKPQFSFPYLNATTQTPLTNTYGNSTGQGSRWLAQVGLRYIFN